MRKKGSKRRRVRIIALASFLALLFFLSIDRRGFIRQIRIRQEKERLKKEIEALKVEKEKLAEEKKTLDDPENVEKIARENHGMGREGDVVYRVVPKERSR